MKSGFTMRAVSWVVAVLFAAMIAACAPTQSNYEGGAVGGAIGAAAGALIDKNNPWRGAVIGGALGAVAGSSLAEISKRAAAEARQYNRPVSYQRRTSEGWERVEAVPQPGSGNQCVEVKTFRNGQLVNDQVSCQ